MSLSVRTFSIPDSNASASEAEITAFLHQVTVDRIETAYAPGGWKLLVFYTDPRGAEEANQIVSVISTNLRIWRSDMAATLGIDPDHLLPDMKLDRIAQTVPTTSLELRLILGEDSHRVLFDHDAEIVSIVRNTLDELS